MPFAVGTENGDARRKSFAIGCVHYFAFHQNLRSRRLALLDDRQRIGGSLLRIDVTRQVAKRDGGEAVCAQVAHELLEPFWSRMDPRMFPIRDAVKLQHRDAP